MTDCLFAEEIMEFVSQLKNPVTANRTPAVREGRAVTEPPQKQRMVHRGVQPLELPSGTRDA